MLVLQRASCAGKYVFFAHSHKHRGEFLVFTDSEGEEMPEFPFPGTAGTAGPGRTSVSVGVLAFIWKLGEVFVTRKVL